MGSILLIVPAALLTATVAAAQEVGDTSAASRLSIGGYAEASYTYSTNNAGGAIIGRLYDRFHDQVELNALTVVLDKPYDASTWSAGFHAEALFGQNASVIKSAGFDLGSQGDLPHLYVTANIPTSDGNGVQVKAGRIPTLMGLEVIEDIANPNWSEGNQFIYVENFTGLGLSLEHRFSERVDAQFRIINGWDVVQDNNSRKSFMARIGLAPAKDVSLALLGYYGPEQVDNPTADRYGTEVLTGARLGRRTMAWLQADYGREEANDALPDPTGDASWWAVGVWLTRDLTPDLSLAFRGDYVDDRNGARTNAVLGLPANTGHRFGSVTITLNARSWKGLLVRPEVRYDRSSLAAFNGKQDQVTVALSAAYLY